MNIPTLANSSGRVVLRNERNLLMDSIEYNEDWHFPYLSSVEGVSLERIDFIGESYQASSWASAASTENVNDEELVDLGKKGVLDEDGSRRGPLALDLESVKTIKDYFMNKRHFFSRKQIRKNKHGSDLLILSITHKKIY